jgi:hypothetical protein
MHAKSFRRGELRVFLRAAGKSARRNRALCDAHITSENSAQNLTQQGAAAAPRRARDPHDSLSKRW